MLNTTLLFECDIGFGGSTTITQQLSLSYLKIIISGHGHLDVIQGLFMLGKALSM